MAAWIEKATPFRGWALDPEQGRSAAVAVADWASTLAPLLEPLGALRWRGEIDAPSLHLDDVSAIPFLVDISGVEEYQHRARLRATGDDLFVAVTEPAPGYEHYCRESLGLGAAEAVIAESDSPLEIARACMQPRTLRELAAAARERGALMIHPYMGIEAVWELAARLAAESSVRIEVLAPPPPVTWIANDKARFSELVELVLGEGWLVDQRRGSEPSELASQLVELAGRHDRVGLKRLRCASAMGNRVIAAKQVRSGGAEEALRLVRDFLTRTEWPEGEEVLVEAWESTDQSPSTQLWIPPRERGWPRLDGVYDQILVGESGVFLGSRPSALPLSVQRELGEAALRVAAGLQALGYVGRCSFDHLVVGDPEGEHELRFTECNGRWGGTSTPMSLVDRLLGAPRPPYRAQDLVAEGLRGRTFPEVLEAVGDRLWDHRLGRGTYLFYNVGPLSLDGKLDVVAVAETQERAEEALELELPRALGLTATTS